MSNSTPGDRAAKSEVEAFLRERGFDPTPAQVDRLAAAFNRRDDELPKPDHIVQCTVCGGGSIGKHYIHALTCDGNHEQGEHCNFLAAGRDGE